MKNTLALLLFLPYYLIAQTTSQVVNSETNEPIPFVNIWVKGSQVGTTSNVNGKFEIIAKPLDTLVFSAVGFKSKDLLFKNLENAILMNPSIEQLDEIVIRNPKFSVERNFAQLKLRKYNKSWACGIVPWMVGSKIPYNIEFDETPFLKQIIVATRSQIDNAKFGLRLYEGSDSLYENPLNSKPIYAVAKKGKREVEIDLQDLWLQFPKDGLVLVFEFLIIPENRYDYTVTMQKTGTKESRISYQPTFLIRDPKQLNATHTGYSNGRWRNASSSFYNKPDSELALQLIMTN